MLLARSFFVSAHHCVTVIEHHSEQCTTVKDVTQLTTVKYKLIELLIIYEFCTTSNSSHIHNFLFFFKAYHSDIKTDRVGDTESKLGASTALRYDF